MIQSFVRRVDLDVNKLLEQGEHPQTLPVFRRRDVDQLRKGVLCSMLLLEIFHMEIKRPFERIRSLSKNV